MISALTISPLGELFQPLPVIPWDGMWNLDNDAEMLAMIQTLAQDHQPALMILGREWQMGWRGRNRTIWGMRLPTPQRAIRDATERLFKSIKGRDVVNGDCPPNPQIQGWRQADIVATLTASKDA